MIKIKFIEVFDFKFDDNYNLVLAFVKNKLAYIGFENDDLKKFFEYEKLIKISVIKKYEKYISMIKNFKNRCNQVINIEDFYVEGSEKEILVWSELLKLNFEQKLTYKQLSERLSMPKAYRFVASCVAKNPILLLIPCHRIFGVKNKFAYRSGSNIKKFLIDNKY